MKTKILLCTAATALALATGAFAQGPGYGPGMGGYGPGMGGYSPGMMGGGMMGGGMMGGGMMGGGMMGGYGYGSPLAALQLSEDQQQKILQIQEENRRKNWDTMGRMQSEMFRLRSLLYSDKSDGNAIVEQQKKVDDLRRQMLASRLESRRQVEQVLSAEQRKQLRSYGPWWMEGSE